MGLIADRHFAVAHVLEVELKNIERKIFKQNPTRETTGQIYNLKRELLEIKRAISPLVDICNSLMRFDIKCI